MKHQDPSKLDRLIALAAEAEQILARGIPTHDIRHACALARGYLELARSYGEPVNVDDVERVLARMRTAFALKKRSAEPATDDDLLAYDPA